MISNFQQQHSTLKYILLLFELFSAVCVFSQTTLQEFDIEKDNNPQVFYKGKGCTPGDGVIVFYTTIPDLKFSMPDTPNRLKNVSAFDRENNCYVLCVQPTDTRIGGIAQYSIAITANEYKPMPAFMVSGIAPGVTQYFNIKIEEDWKSAYESLKGEIAKLKKENGEVTSPTKQSESKVPAVAPSLTTKSNENPSLSASSESVRSIDPLVKSVINYINQDLAEKAIRYKTDEDRFFKLKSKGDLKSLIDMFAKQIYSVPQVSDKEIVFFCKSKETGGDEPLFIFFNRMLVGVGTTNKGFSVVMANNESSGTFSVCTFSKEILTTFVNFSTKQKYMFDWMGKVLVML